MSPSCYLLISVATRLKSKALTLRTYVTYTCDVSRRIQNHHLACPQAIALKTPSAEVNAL